MESTKKHGFSLITILTVIFLVYFFYMYLNQSKMIRTKQEELTQINLSIKEENKLNAKLNERLETIHSEEEIRKAARQKLGLVNTGEKIFIDWNKK
jgi:cell division protein FtsL